MTAIPLLRACLLALAWLLLAVPAWAQPAAPPPHPGLTPQQAQQALEVLRDPQRRAEVLSVLELSLIHI